MVFTTQARGPASSNMVKKKGGRCQNKPYLNPEQFLAVLTGFEPAISTVTVWHPGPAERQHQINIVLDIDQYQSTIL